MNRELIERIYHEAVDHCVALGQNPDGSNHAWEWEQKFTELVALEAARVCEKVYPEGSPLHLVSLGFGQTIKDHFGITK